MGKLQHYGTTGKNDGKMKGILVDLDEGAVKTGRLDVGSRTGVCTTCMMITIMIYNDIIIHDNRNSNHYLHGEQKRSN